MKTTTLLAAILFVGCGGKTMTPDEVIVGQKFCIDKGMVPRPRESLWNRNIQSVHCVKERECIERREEP